MDAIKYLKERKRMCDGSNCWECPLYEKNNGKRVNCQAIEKKYAEEAVAIVEKWSAEHPANTRQSEFLKLFPNAKINSSGVLAACPVQIDENAVDACKDSCEKCRKKYWLSEVE